MTKTKMTGLIAGTAALAACSGAPSDDAAEQLSERGQATTLVPTLLAHGAANGLQATTGHLYWTTDYVFSNGAPTTSTLWRASKDTTPGEEVALFTASAPAPGPYFFGNLSWPVGGADFVYFAVNYEVNGVPTSQIQRAPLAGGPAKVLATSPAYIGTRDVVADDEFVYWVDAGGVRKVSVNGTGIVVRESSPREALSIGGTLHNGVVTLATTTTSSHLGLDAANVYFGEGSEIESVPKAGGSVYEAAVGYANVTASTSTRRTGTSTGATRTEASTASRTVGPAGPTSFKARSEGAVRSPSASTARASCGSTAWPAPAGAPCDRNIPTPWRPS